MFDVDKKNFSIKELRNKVDRNDRKKSERVKI